MARLNEGRCDDMCGMSARATWRGGGGAGATGARSTGAGVRAASTPADCAPPAQSETPILN